MLELFSVLFVLCLIASRQNAIISNSFIISPVVFLPCFCISTNVGVSHVVADARSAIESLLFFAFVCDNNFYC